MRNAKLRRPKLKAIDFVPFYGLYTYEARLNPEIGSFKDFLKDGLNFRKHLREWRELPLEEIVTLGTARWPIPKTFREHIDQSIVAAQNSAVVTYHFLPCIATLYGIMYGFSKLRDIFL